VETPPRQESAGDGLSVSMTRRSCLRYWKKVDFLIQGGRPKSAGGGTIGNGKHRKADPEVENVVHFFSERALQFSVLKKTDTGADQLRDPGKDLMDLVETALFFPCLEPPPTPPTHTKPPPRPPSAAPAPAPHSPPHIQSVPPLSPSCPILTPLPPRGESRSSPKAPPPTGRTPSLFSKNSRTW